MSARILPGQSLSLGWSAIGVSVHIYVWSLYRGIYAACGTGTPACALHDTARSGCVTRAASVVPHLRIDHRRDPLTRPAPADESAGRAPPSPPKGRGL